MKSLLQAPLRWAHQGLLWAANSPRTLITSYLAMIVVSGVLYSFAEDKSAGDSVWWAIVTASTVGYGDISPTTPLGRALAAVLISTMVLLVIPLITAHFASKLIVDHDAFRHEEQEELKANLRAVRQLLEELATRQGGAGPAGAPTERAATATDQTVIGEGSAAPPGGLSGR